MTTTVEYRVRPVTRYIVTRFVRHEENQALSLPGGVGSSVLGTFDRQQDAGFVAEMCSKSDANVNRVVWEPHEEPPQALPDERYAVGGDLHHAMTI